MTTRPETEPSVTVLVADALAATSLAVAGLLLWASTLDGSTGPYGYDGVLAVGLAALGALPLSVSVAARLRGRRGLRVLTRALLVALLVLVTGVASVPAGDLVTDALAARDRQGAVVIVDAVARSCAERTVATGPADGQRLLDEIGDCLVDRNSTVVEPAGGWAVGCGHGIEICWLTPPGDHALPQVAVPLAAYADEALREAGRTGFVPPVGSPPIPPVLVPGNTSSAG